jgi:hypothetical protein
MDAHITKKQSTPSKARVTLLSFAVLLLITVVASFFLRTPEPSYAGVSLGIWCERICDSREGQAEAMKAVHNIGSNAVPWLLNEMRSSERTIRSRANELLARQSVVKWRFEKPSTSWSTAMCGFVALGGEGRKAIPELESMVTEENPRCLMATMSLAGIGHEAVPLLCRHLTNGSMHVASAVAASIPKAAFFGRLNDDDLNVLLTALRDQSKWTNDFMSEAITKIESISLLKVKPQNYEAK